MKLHTIEELTDVRGKYILLRDDFNVQIVDGKITDPFRIQQSLPTIEKLKEGGARIAICAHFGRPDGEKNMKYSLAPVAEFLNIKLIPDCLDKDFLSNMSDGEVVLLENLRFYPGEEENNRDFAKELAKGYDYFVNDAFAVSHRAHASTVGVAEILPSFAGELLAHEIEEISHVMENPKRPLLAIVAGAKISSKIGLLHSLVKLCDKIIIGGAIGTTFNYALGEPVGNSLYEPDKKEEAMKILAMAQRNDCEIILPIDKGTAKTATPDAERTDKFFDEIEQDDIILDAGVRSIIRYKKIIDECKTVIWNGTIGMAEWQPTWSMGTFSLAHYIAARTEGGEIESIIGGGDTVAALEATGTKNSMTYVSTGGGAFLEYIEGRTLPGIKALTS